MPSRCGIILPRNAGRRHYSTMLLVNTIPGAGTAIMIFLRLAGFFRRFLKYVCPAFSVPGSRSGVQRTPRLNTLEGNPVQLGRGDKKQKSEIRDQKSEVRSRRSEIGRQNAEDEIAGFCEVVMPCNIIHVMALGEESVNFTKIGIINKLRYYSSCYSGRFSNLFLCGFRRLSGRPSHLQF